MKADTRRTLLIVVGLGLLLVGGIYAAVRSGSGHLSDEEATERASEIAQDLQASAREEQAQREKLIQRIDVISKKRPGGKLPGQARKKLWETYKELTPEQQVTLLRFLMPQEFSDWLDKFQQKHTTPEARKQEIDRAVGEMRKKFDELSEAELWERRQKVDTPQGKAYIKTMQRFYADRMSAKQRSEFEPMAKEMLRQMDMLLQARKPAQK